MTKYIHCLEFRRPSTDTDEDKEGLNQALEKLQKENTDIIDIKFNTVYDQEDNSIIRTYLIIYEADKPIL